MRKSYLFTGLILALTLVPLLAFADARLTSVTPVDGGCVSGPTGPSVQSWDVETGKTYTIRIEGVSECADNGTDGFLDVRVKSTNTGNTDLVATFVEPGVYEFDFTMPDDGMCTYPVLYCTTPGDYSTGIFAIRDDGVYYQAHLRASVFEEGCLNPMEILDGDCDAVGFKEMSWGGLKATYN